MPVAGARVAKGHVRADERGRQPLAGREMLIEMPGGERGIDIAHGPSPPQHGTESARDQRLGQRTHFTVSSVLPSPTPGEKGQGRTVREGRHDLVGGAIGPVARLILQHEDRLAVFPMTGVPGEVQHIEEAGAVVLHERRHLLQAATLLHREIHRPVPGGGENVVLFLLEVQDRLHIVWTRCHEEDLERPVGRRVKAGACVPPAHWQDRGVRPVQEKVGAVVHDLPRQMGHPVGYRNREHKHGMLVRRGLDLHGEPTLTTIQPAKQAGGANEIGDLRQCERARPDSVRVISPEAQLERR